MRVGRESLRCFIHEKLVAKPACLRTSSYCPTVRNGACKITWEFGELDGFPALTATARSLMKDRSASRDDTACRFSIGVLDVYAGFACRELAVSRHGRTSTTDTPKCKYFLSGRAPLQIPIKMQFLVIVLAFFLQPHTAFSLPSLSLINPSLSHTQNTAISNLSKPT